MYPLHRYCLVQRDALRDLEANIGVVDAASFKLRKKKRRRLCVRELELYLEDVGIEEWACKTEIGSVCCFLRVRKAR